MVNGQSVTLFPTPQQVIKADLMALKTTGQRKQTLVAFATAVQSGKISLEPTQDVEQFLKSALAIKGIGPWTAQYMALKGLRDTVMFPASDLILARALELHPREILETMSPWRGYVAALFWQTYTGLLNKKNSQRKKS